MGEAAEIREVHAYAGPRSDRDVFVEPSHGLHFVQAKITTASSFPHSKNNLSSPGTF